MSYEYLGYWIATRRRGLAYTAKAVRPPIPPDEHTPFECPAMEITGLNHDGFAAFTQRGSCRKAERAIRHLREAGH